MGMLDGFEKVILFTGIPYVSVTRNGITFNKPTIIKLGSPSHVELLINKREKQIAIRVCDGSDDAAAAFYKNKGKKVMNVRWNNKDLLTTLSNMMGWDLDATDGYRIDGKYYENENAMIYDLKEAKPILAKDKN